jgi:hypothetical protein
MSFMLEPAAPYAQQLNILISRATFNPENEWFFFDGAFNSASCLENGININTWLHENFVAVYNKEIIGYFEGVWNRPLDIIAGFRTINFTPKYSRIFVSALFEYFDYLFVKRGCTVFNWTVALLNEHALNQYERFVTDYCGHRVGLRHQAQKSYTGKVSDIYLYEIVRDEYLEWKARNFKKRPSMH